jgi:hypothetical protein
VAIKYIRWILVPPDVYVNIWTITEKKNMCEQLLGGLDQSYRYADMLAFALPLKFDYLIFFPKLKLCSAVIQIVPETHMPLLNKNEHSKYQNCLFYLYSSKMQKY